MAYTSGASMEDDGLRDVERWKDKIEVRLDNRQVFVLFFGSALVACLLFILGVIVGKRLESRGRAVAPEIEDPLELLDRIATGPTRPVTEKPALSGATRRAGSAGPSGAGESGTSLKVVQAPAPKAPPVAPPTGTPPAPPPPAPVAAVRATPTEPPATVAPPPRAVPGPAAARGVATPIPAAKPAVDSTAGPGATASGSQARSAEGAPKAAGAESAPKAAVAPEPVRSPGTDGAASAPIADLVAGAPAAAAEGAGSSVPKARGRFTLQIGSFPTREEAEACARRFTGYTTYIVVSEVPDKGTWYRVRTGDFASFKDGEAAKLAFEKRHKELALVAPR